MLELSNACSKKKSCGEFLYSSMDLMIGEKNRKVNNVMDLGNGVQFWAYPSPNIGTCESILSITAPMCSS